MAFWGQQNGPLSLGENLGAMPKGVRDFIPKFNGDGKTLAEDHLSSFKVVCGTIDVPTEDVTF